MKITDALIAEHVVFHTLFDEAEILLRQSTSLAEVRATCALVGRLLERHSVAEHDLLLPSIDPYLEQIGQMKNFHKEDDVIVELLKKAAAAESFADASKTLRKAIQFSREHFDKEERIIFPLADRNLKPESLERLGAEWAKLKEVRVSSPSVAQI